jgi:hypothetical protein
MIPAGLVEWSGCGGCSAWGDGWDGVRLRLSHPQAPVAWSVFPLLAVHAWAHAPDRQYPKAMVERRAYPSDLSDARRKLIEPVLSAWRAERRRHALNIGRPPEHDLREIMNAMLYGTHLVDQVAAAHPTIRKVWVTAATAPTSPSTQPPSASTWKSSNALPGPGDLLRCPNAGLWRGPTGG